MRARLVVLSLAVVAGCRGGSDAGGRGSAGSAGPAGSGGQTMSAALAILCGRGGQPPDVSAMTAADRERELGDWLDREIKNPSARALIATLADGRDREARVRRAAVDAGILDCRPLALFGPRPVGGTDVADVAVAPAGTGALDQDLPVVVVTPSAVIVDGRVAIAVRAKAIDGADVPVLAAALATFAAHAGEAFTAAVVAVDRTLPAPVVATVLAALAAAGVTRVELAVGIGTSETRSIPVRLTAPSGAPAHLHLTIADDAVTVATGPRIPLAPAATMRDALHAALRALVGAPGAPGTEADPTIIVAVEGMVAMQAIAEVLASVRAAADGTPLFPDVVLVRAAPARDKVRP